MTNVLAGDKHSCMTEGIKAVGVGKKGSSNLTALQVQAILDELKQDIVPAVVKGAFFGALFIKGIDATEQNLASAFTPGTLNNPSRLIEAIAPEAPKFIKDFCVRLLKHQYLSREDARQLGDFLLSREPGDGPRGMAASILRVPFETDDEYERILQRLNEKVSTTV